VLKIESAMMKHIVIAKPMQGFCALGMGCGNLARLVLQDCHGFSPTHKAMQKPRNDVQGISVLLIHLNKIYPNTYVKPNPKVRISPKGAAAS